MWKGCRNGSRRLSILIVGRPLGWEGLVGQPFFDGGRYNMGGTTRFIARSG